MIITLINVLHSGTRLDVECTLNTMDMSKPLLNGLKTQEEMCVAFLLIYPKISVSTCNSMSDSAWYTFNLSPFFSYTQRYRCQLAILCLIVHGTHLIYFDFSSQYFSTEVATGGPIRQAAYIVKIMTIYTLFYKKPVCKKLDPPRPIIWETERILFHNLGSLFVKKKKKLVRNF